MRGEEVYGQSKECREETSDGVAVGFIVDAVAWDRWSGATTPLLPPVTTGQLPHFRFSQKDDLEHGSAIKRAGTT